jgi:prevent-host-death family protein
METISQRQLRNENAAVMRSVEEGETFVVTRRGVRVAVLAPYREDADLRCLKPAKHPLDPSRLRRISSTTPTAQVLEDLRGER